MSLLSLSEIEIGNTVETIYTSAFWLCSNFSSVVIPASVKTIEGSAFSSPGLKEVIYKGKPSKGNMKLIQSKQCLNKIIYMNKYHRKKLI